MSSPPITDAQEADILARAKGGDREAFGELVRAHQRRTYALSLRILGNAQEADDAVQETYLRAWRALPKFDQKSALATWLYRICVNVCLNVLRKRRRVRAAMEGPDPRVPDPSQASAAAPDEAADRVALFARLATALDGLSPSLRVTAVLVLIEGVSLSSAAEILGCPEGTVAWRMHEARRKLRDALHGDGAGGGNS